MSIFKWFKKSKKDLELDLVKVKSKLDSFNVMYNGRTVPMYTIEEYIHLKAEYDVLKFKIENYED